MKRKKNTDDFLATLMGIFLASKESLLYQDLLKNNKKQEKKIEPKRPDIPVVRVQPKKNKRRK